MTKEKSPKTGPADTDLVRAALDDDIEAFEALYDRYADRVHAFCFSRLRNDDDAADALRATFGRACSRLGQLDDPSQFRPWIFGIARNAIVGIARDRGREIRRRDWGPIAGGRNTTGPNREDPTDALEPDHAMIAAESAELLWETTAGLQPREQELLELHLREGLDGDDLARAMDVEPSHLPVMVTRLKARLSNAVGSLLVARLGRRECDDLDAFLSDWNGRYSVAVRSTVSRHVESCDACQRTRLSAAAWESIAAAMPSAPAPAAARLAVLTEVARQLLESDPNPPLVESTPAPTSSADADPSPDSRADADADQPDETLAEPEMLEAATVVDGEVDRRRIGARIRSDGALAGSTGKFLGVVVAMTAVVLAWPVAGDNAPSDVIVAGPDALAEVAGVSELAATTTVDAATTTTAATMSGVVRATPPIFFGDLDPIEFPLGVDAMSYTFGNVGGTPMSWAATTTSPFSVTLPRGTLLPGETITVEVRLDARPTGEGATGTLAVATDGGDLSIELRTVAVPAE